MKKGETGTGVIGPSGFPDRGYVRREDGDVLLKHAVPGRTVEYRITKKRNGKAEGMILRTLKLSPEETEEGACPVNGVCGGCLYQTLPYEMQLSLKERQLKKLLRDMTGKEILTSGAGTGGILWDGIAGSPLPEGYRNKMEYSFGDSTPGGPLELGMHRRGSRYDIVSADGCRLVHPDYSLILRETVRYFREESIPYYHKVRRDGCLRHLLVRRAEKSGEILVCLVTVSGHPALKDEVLREWCRRILSLPLAGTFAGVLHTVNDSAADAVIDQGTSILYGRDWFSEELSGLKFRITPFSFFQNNSGAAEILYGTVASYIGDMKGKLVYDLYCGTGTIAQITASAAKKTVGVELVEEAVEAARDNAARNGIRNCEFIAGDVLKVLDSLTERPDTIILDPPREGVHPKALKKIVSYGVPSMVYVSCKPTSLGKDLEVLREAGYEPVRARAVDMFPQTPNAELVLLLRKEEKGVKDGSAS